MALVVSLVTPLVLALLALGGVGWWMIHRPCSHSDADGHSLLIWRRVDDRICGWCPKCERTTRGWLFPAAKKL